jgi:hypothetical protein
MRSVVAKPMYDGNKENSARAFIFAQFSGIDANNAE